MLDVNRILKSNRLLRALTALTRKAFDALLPSFRKVFEAANQSTSKRRQRGPGAGHKAKIPGSVARISVGYKTSFPYLRLTQRSRRFRG